MSILCLAGGGVKGGHSHGETDDLGYEAVLDKVHIHDLHATMLHLLGLDHERLTYRYAGRDFRLTDAHGNVVRGLAQQKVGNQFLIRAHPPVSWDFALRIL